ncbi:M14 family metallopeptidase [Massilia antarctica]|uniref:M14 family metallopeptidase n=1 Tax=Massilia antarctica TaxID=2765360 RepID=UPI0006BB82FE|nr:M14 family metallopeptidase [Massilia sp. H27-R4]MCY0911865.1 M14 family metallopeptidase [Massilia sp. H27-R4]CUI06679.1 Gll2474 protein [Janthinobacterium sp. CG23_2]CUU30465.1 Gll2474 protein [Janthinobacterium sp. CG23_2]
MIRSALLLALLSAIPMSHAAPDLSTVAERSQFQKTGRYDEVIALCSAFQKAYPKQVRCIEFGRTPEGRPMQALVVTRTGAMTAQAAAARAIPVVLVQGGIHAGEIDGKDAGFLALREVLDNRAAPGALDKQVLLFVPVFNVDGHERFKQWNRPNQRGPVEMGWRTTGQNFNLNRDYAKADSIEMQAMLALVNAWDPLVYVDLHVTDGAKFEHDISIQVEPVHSADAEFRKAGLALRSGVLADITKLGSMPLPFYMSFAEDDNPASGFADGVSDPRFSTGYFALRNRIGMLVETHSWKDYPTRVRITRNSVVSVLDQVAQHGKAWQAVAREADARAARLGGTELPLTYKATDKVRMIDFRGYAYTRTPSDVSGALMTRYDETKPQIWTVPLRDEIVSDVMATAPKAGYIVPAAHAAMVARKLSQHGIAYRTLGAVDAKAKADVETFRAEKVTFAPGSLESHQRVTVQGAWKAEPRALEKGALFVPVAQAKARLVIALFEPAGPDSLLQWGMFNTVFERKEYMEDYVAEEVAREMMAADPAVAAAFKAKVDSDPAFAKNPQARLEFFARRHSSYDERLNLYPVLRTAVAP